MQYMDYRWFPLIVDKTNNKLSRIGTVPTITLLIGYNAKSLFKRPKAPHAPAGQFLVICVGIQVKPTGTLVTFNFYLP